MRTKEHNQHIREALSTPEIRNLISIKTKLALSGSEIRKRISENTKKAFANGKPKLTSVKGKVGDTICASKLGKTYRRTLTWCACPKCGSERWVRKNLIGKYCTQCAHSCDEIKSKLSSSGIKSYKNNPKLNRMRKELYLGKKRDWSPTQEHIEIIRQINRGNQQSPEYREKRRKMSLKMWENPKHVDNMRQKSTEMWKNPEFKQMMVTKWAKSIRMKPNKAERKLNRMIQVISRHKFALNVKGNIMILGGKIPDFVNINGKKSCIELYGDYFHKDEEPNDRIEYFKKFGYETLIIWESELKNESWLKQKVSKWMKVNA